MVIIKYEGGVEMEGFYIMLSVILLILLGLLGIVVYFLPSIIAYKRGHVNKGIILLNIFLGWTLIGWVGCLVWAFIDNGSNKVNNDKYGDLARIQKLKENGTITETEFELEKRKLLK